ncbi:MAG: hypothetical protein JXB14_06265 [Candidatus Altiarchaeota archaeon]|nr:hypothetical protein [Candidatus Altiarchaeota archaeon]
MADMSYVVGRLHGLNELVKILKDMVKNKKATQNAEMIEVMADHISEQLEAIIGEFEGGGVKPEHKEKLAEAKEKVVQSQRKVEEAETPEEKLDEHSKTVDELLRDLESMK